MIKKDSKYLDDMLIHSLKEHRDITNMTQKEAALAMKINRGTYEKIETGWRRAGRLELIRLMVKYFQSVDDDSGDEPMLTILECCGCDIPLLKAMLLKNEGLKLIKK